MIDRAIVKWLARVESSIRDLPSANPTKFETVTGVSSVSNRATIFPLLV